MKVSFSSFVFLNENLKTWVINLFHCMFVEHSVCECQFSIKKKSKGL